MVEEGAGEGRPLKLNAYSLTPLDVTSALRTQNVQISGGQLGGTPAVKNQQLNATITESTLLRTLADFGNILLKVLTDGSQVRARDAARLNLGAESFNVDNKYNGQPASGIGIQLAPGANALATVDAVRARIAELEPYFPHGLKVVYPNDVAPFVKSWVVTHRFSFLLQTGHGRPLLSMSRGACFSAVGYRSSAICAFAGFSIRMPKYRCAFRFNSSPSPSTALKMVNFLQSHKTNDVKLKCLAETFEISNLIFSALMDMGRPFEGALIWYSFSILLGNKPNQLNAFPSKLLP